MPLCFMAGRPKAIETPEELLKLFQDFKKWVEVNPYKWHDFVGKDAEEVWKERQRPLTWIGFEGYLAREGHLVHLGHYEQNTGGAYDDFLPIIRVIKRECSADIIEGAMSGVFNQNIAARLEGLADKKEVDKVVKRIKFTDAAG